MKFTMIRRITALGLILVLAAGIPIQASSASTEKVTEDDASTKSLQEAQDEKAQLEKALKEAQGTIEDLKDSKGDIESKVTELNQQLIDISARITDLENQLTAKSEDIQETKDELAGAKEREAQQYADMKVRIQFMYENGQTSYLEALLSSRNISEFLNSADYIAQIQSYDRQKLTEYQDTVESIVNLEAQLEQEYTDLEALKSTVESNKATVAAMMRQKEQNKQHPVYRLFTTRTNTIRKHQRSPMSCAMKRCMWRRACGIRHSWTTTMPPAAMPAIWSRKRSMPRRERALPGRKSREYVPLRRSLPKQRGACPADTEWRSAGRTAPALPERGIPDHAGRKLLRAVFSGLSGGRPQAGGCAGTAGRGAAV